MQGRDAGWARLFGGRWCRGSWCSSGVLPMGGQGRGDVIDRPGPVVDGVVGQLEVRRLERAAMRDQLVELEAVGQGEAGDDVRAQAFDE